MWTADSNGDTDFTQFQMSKSMNDSNAGDWPAFSDFGFKFFHLGDCHFWKRIIVECQSLTPVRHFSDRTQKKHEGARLVRTNLLSQCLVVNDVVSQFNHPKLTPGSVVSGESLSVS